MGATTAGFKELQKALTTLGERTQRKLLRQAVNVAATPILKAARGNAPEESGTLEESLAKKIKTYPEDMTVVAIIGPDTQTTGEFNGKTRVPWRYAHLVENGHIAADGSFVPPHPFLRPAYDSTQEQALDVMKDRLGKGIEREAAKQE